MRAAVQAIGIFGAGGRMGRAIAAAVDELGAAVAAGIDRPGEAGSLPGGRPFARDPAEVARASAALVDFSTPDALSAHLAAAADAAIPILVGTTGLGPEHHRLLDEAARAIPVLQAANTSLGVTLLARLVREAAARLGPDWDLEIVEMHHRHKVDAPSGTALLLGQAAADGRGVDLGAASERGRDGLTGPRRAGAIGFASLRGGSVAGDHLVVLAGEGERVELGHRAEGRAIFARGAVRGALWLIGRPPGRYAMDDVLGLA